MSHSLAKGSRCQRAAGAHLESAVCSGLNLHGMCPDCCPFWSDLREQDLLPSDWVGHFSLRDPSSLGLVVRGGVSSCLMSAQILSLLVLREQVGVQEREARLCLVP